MKSLKASHNKRLDTEPTYSTNKFYSRDEVAKKPLFDEEGESEDEKESDMAGWGESDEEAREADAEVAGSVPGPSGEHQLHILIPSYSNICVSSQNI